MAFKKTFSDIARSEFQTIYDGMLSTDKLYIQYNLPVNLGHR